MCFSATSSFTVAATLFPVGVYCVSKARTIDPKWLPLACFPIAFSIQQASEGFLWLNLESGNQVSVLLLAKVFIFFSHFFWLAWVPFSIYCLEPDDVPKKILKVFTWLGALAGLSVFLPILYMANWVTVDQVQHSLRYEVTLIYDGIIHRTILRWLYALLIVLTFLISSIQGIRIFGWLIVATLVLSNHYFHHALISVWCYFAAIASAYILTFMYVESRRFSTNPG